MLRLAKTLKFEMVDARLPMSDIDSVDSVDSVDSGMRVASPAFS